MALYICQACGGEVVRKADDTYVCLYCGTTQTFNDFSVSGNLLTSLAAAAKEKNYAAAYSNACCKLSSAKTSYDFKAVGQMFEQISPYRDSSVQMSGCYQKAEKLQMEEKYTSACNMMNEDNLHFMQQAASIFRTIPEYKDSSSRYNECIAKICSQEEILAKKNRESRDANAKKDEEDKKKRHIVFIIVLIAFVLYILISAIK